MERRSLTFTIFIHLSALLLAVIILAPMLWLFVMSISPAADLTAKPLNWWPTAIDLSRYQFLLSRIPNSAGAAFTAALINSIMVAGMATLAALVVVCSCRLGRRRPARHTVYLVPLLRSLPHTCCRLSRLRFLFTWGWPHSTCSIQSTDWLWSI